MTCIVGYVDKNGVYIGGDSAAVSEDDLSYNIRSDEKVFTKGEFIFGYSTSFRMGQLLRYKLKIPAHPKGMDTTQYMVTLFIDAIRRCFEDNDYNDMTTEDGGSFMLGYKGKLYVVLSLLGQRPYIVKIKDIPHRISALEENYNHLQKNIKDKVHNLPNILDKSVPLGENEEKNKVIKKVGAIKKPKFAVKNHADFASSLNLLDIEKASKVAGARFYYLKNDLVKLNQALLNFALDFLSKKKFTLIQPPYMLNKKSLSGAITFSTFEDTIYKIDNEDLYLIGTSEHSLIGRFIDTILSDKNLPMKFASYSMCFRKEIGSHGIDEKGLFRNHQFNKVEMVVICRPDESMKFFEEMQGITVEIFKELSVLQ